MKTTPSSSQGFTDSVPNTHDKLKKSEVAQENDALAELEDEDDTAPLHRKEDLSHGDEGVDDPQ